MIDNIVKAYRAQNLLLEDVFLAMARSSGKDDWWQNFDLLTKQECEAFWEWAIPLLYEDVILMVTTGNPAIDESQLDALRCRAEESGRSL